MLAKFIDEGRREHEEMEIFIKEFRTTNELLLKTRSNLLSELKIKVNELSKVVSNVLIPKNEVNGVTTRGGKITSEATRSKEINETGINKNEPLRFEQDVQEKPHDDAVLLKEPPLKKDPRIFTIPCQVLEKHKETKDLAADHSSRLENPHMEVLTEREIADEFSDKHLMALKSKSNNDEPWFGVPKALISDRGTHFCNSQLQKALQRYGVTHKLSTAYHPQSNRQTEVTKMAIKRILERSVSYGKACHLPIEIEHKAHWELKQCNMDLTLASESRLMQLNALAELRDGAYENTRIYKKRTKKWHDSRLRGDKDFKTVYTAYPNPMDTAYGLSVCYPVFISSTVYTPYSLNEYSVYKYQYDVSWGMDTAYQLPVQ
ncbi:reverse transcriptase domain-containing protein [Tanacetum coccineum]